MNERLHHLLDSNYYLYNCNLQCDIENNIGEIEIPEFTMEQKLQGKKILHYYNNE